MSPPRAYDAAAIARRAEHRLRVGARLLRIRTEDGGTQRAWAQHAGVSPSTLSRIESGQDRLSQGLLARLPLTEQQRAELRALRDDV